MDPLCGSCLRHHNLRLTALPPQALIPHHLTQPKRSQALPHTNHPHSKVDNFIRPSNKLAVAINPSRCRYVITLFTPFSKNTFAIVAISLPSQTSEKSRNQILTRHFPHRATRPSAPSKSLPKLSVRTAPSPSGSVCAPATPSGKSHLYFEIQISVFLYPTAICGKSDTGKRERKGNIHITIHPPTARTQQWRKEKKKKRNRIETYG